MVMDSQNNDQPMNASHQQSVIQTTNGNQTILLVPKVNSLVQTPGGILQTLQVIVKRDHNQNNNIKTEDNNLSPSRLLMRKKQQYNNSQNAYMANNSHSSDSDVDGDLSSNSMSSYQSMSDALHMTSSQGDNIGNMGSTANMHYGENTQYYVQPNIDNIVIMNSGAGVHNTPHEEPVKKREIRLLKNREAARECRRKKKEYIKCLENRVAVLETQNKALISELKSLKELYSLQKSESK